MKHFAKLTAILIMGGSIALFGGTKLSKAAIAGDLDKVKECISNGEKVNEIDKWGWTPILWAIYYRQEVVAKWLLNHGADPNSQSTMIYGDFPIGTTPLGLAVYYAQEDQVTLLIASKADPSIADSKGKKPMDYAKYYNLEGCASILSGTYKGMPNLHSSINRIISEKLDNVFIIFGSNGQQAKPFLDQLKDSIGIELNKRKMKFNIHVLDPMGMDEEKEIAQKMISLKPNFIMIANESNATIEKKYSSQDIRIGSTFNIEIKRPGNQATLWGKEINAKDSGINPTPFSSSRGDIISVFIKTLLSEMEADLLL